MKKGKIVFVGVMLMFTALSVLAKNNFNEKGFGFFSFEEEEMITYDEMQNFVNERLTKKLEKCYLDAHPEMMMTKCPAGLYLQIGEYQRWSPELKKVKFYQNQTVTGTIIFDDCGMTQRVCSVKMNYKKQEILVKESFFSDWVNAEEYEKSFCKQVAAEKNEVKELIED